MKILALGFAEDQTRHFILLLRERGAVKEMRNFGVML